MSRLLLDQMGALTQEIADGSLGFRLYGALGQHPQAEPVCQPPRIGAIISILETVLLLHRRRIGQVQSIACVHEAIDEPGPIIRGVDDHTLNVSIIRGSLLQERSEIVRQPFVVDPLILLIE